MSAEEKSPSPAAGGQNQEETAPQRVVRSVVPEVLEFPFSALDSFLTPTAQFYVRSHFPTPELRPETWTLRVEGAVDHPLELRYADLQRLEARTLPVTLECAGNGRAYLQPPAEGVRWEQGGISTAEWTGVPLRAVLEQAGLRASAVEIVLEGADRGHVSRGPHPTAPISYARSLPRSPALNGDVFLAYAMNGAPLPQAHGFPLRAIVPGWYGMASVKWLTRIVAVEAPFPGYWQTTDYAYWDYENGLPVRVPITTMRLKSQIARPAPGEPVIADRPYRITGAAWSSGAEITSVEVSPDGGETWHAATLIGPAAAHAWRLWEYVWHTPAQPDFRTLLSRATDSQGRTQPLEHNADYGNYLISHLLPREVEVHPAP